MNTREYLAQYTNIDRRIKDKIDEADKWMDIAYSRSIGKSKEIKHDVIQASHDSQDSIADAIAKSIDYYNEAVRMSKEMIEKKHTIELQIDSIENDNHYNILHDYYVSGKTFEEISKTKYCSRKTVKRKFDAAIECFERMYGVEYF